MAAPADPHGSWLGRLLTDPDGPWRQLGHLLAEHLHLPIGPGTAILAACVAAGITIVAAVARRWRRRRLAVGARLVTVLVPPQVDAASALRWWTRLLGLLRPHWRRTVLGQPHLGFEYTITPDEGATIRVWVPQAIPPGLVERAITSAWPGARTTTADATPPLPSPAGGQRRLLVGGQVRLARDEHLPIQADYPGGDPVRDLLTAAEDLEPGQAACVQILARPATGSRLRHSGLAGVAGVAGLLADLAQDFVELIIPGARLDKAPRSRSSQASSPAERQAMLEYSAEARAAAAKSRGGHWETVIRYAVAVDVPADADRATMRAARRHARGRAHDLASVYGAYTDHNYYRRHHALRVDSALARRSLRRGDLLSVREMAAIAHLPHDSDLPGIARAGARALAPSPAIPATGPHTKPLGVADTGTGRGVAITVPDARHHVHILGATGVGKSTLLANLILADADAGRGLVVVDPKGDLITDVLSRLPQRCAERVVLFDADAKSAPPCMNPLDTDRGDADLAVDNLITIFRRIYSRHWGPRTDDVLRVSLLTLFALPGVATLADLPRLLLEPAFRSRVTARISDPVLQGFWDSYEAMTDGARTEAIAPLLNKLRAVLLRPFARAAVAAGRSTVDLTDVLDHGGICLARLPKGSLGEETSRLVGSLLVARTWQATTARARIPAPARADATVILDEAHNFLTLAIPVEDMLAEARGLRLSLVLAHQNLGQLPREMRDGVSANARNKIIFSASPEDARELARHTAPALSEHDLTHLDAYHAAARVLVDGQQAPPFTLTTRPLPPPVPGRAREIRAAARARQATPPPATGTAPDSGPGDIGTDPRR